MNKYASLPEMNRIAQLEGLLTAADAEIQAQIRSRIDLENKVRTLTNELRITLQSLGERTKRVQQLEDHESKAATELSSLVQRLTAVRNRKEELEKQVTTLNQTIANLTKKLATESSSSSSSSTASSSAAAVVSHHEPSSHPNRVPSVPKPPSSSREKSLPRTLTVPSSDSSLSSSSLPTGTTNPSSSSVTTLTLSPNDKKDIHQHYLLLQGLRSQVILLRNMFIDARTKYATGATNYEQRIRTIEQENHQLLQENSTLRIQLSSYEEKKVHENYDITSIKGEILTLRSRLLSADTQIQSLMNQLKDENDKVLHTETNYRTVQDQYHELLRQLTDQETYITTLLNEKQTFEQQSQSYQSMHRTLQNDYDRLRFQSQEKDLKHTETMSSIMHEINSLVHQQKNVENLVQSLQTEKLEAYNEIQRLTNECNRLRSFAVNPSSSSSSFSPSTDSNPILLSPLLPLFGRRTETRTSITKTIPEQIDDTGNANNISNPIVPLSSSSASPLPVITEVNNYTKHLNELQLRFQEEEEN